MYVTKRNVQNCTVDTAVRLQAILGRVDTAPTANITESIREAVEDTTKVYQNTFKNDRGVGPQVLSSRSAADR